MNVEAADQTRSGDPVLTVSDLVVEFRTPTGIVRAVDHMSYEVQPGETIGVVGESGSGKTVSALAVLGLLPRRHTKVSGSVILAGTELLGLPAAVRRRKLGSELALVFQDPMSALNPVMSVGMQIVEGLRAHDGSLGHKEAHEKAVSLLEMVRVPEAAERFDRYPHEFSGGMRQRAVIAMAIANRPRVLFADEPTTALDVTVQAQILELLHVVQSETNASMIFISHDFGVISEMAARIVVMYAGKVIERGETQEILRDPHHPYTVGLLSCLPSASHPRLRLNPIAGQPPDMSALPPGCAFAPRCEMAEQWCQKEVPALRVIDWRAGESTHYAACHFAERVPEELLRRPGSLGDDPEARVSEVDLGSSGDNTPVLRTVDLVKHFSSAVGLFGRSSKTIKAVDGVSFDISGGQTLGLVGESGCGKSSAAQTLLRLQEASSGRIELLGRDLRSARGKDLRELRQKMQLVFQDPYTSLNPTLTASRNVEEPLRVHGGYGRAGRRRRAHELLEQVGLGRTMADRMPAELSGGQRQRVGIARALAPGATLLVLDEPVSSLDVSVRAQVLNLLKDLQAKYSLTYLLISHDLSVVEYMSDLVAVMYLGKIIEIGDARQIYSNPQHPYTIALLSAVPNLERSAAVSRPRVVLEGDLPSPSSPPSGCRFRTRCWRAQEICSQVEPPLEAETSGPEPRHRRACHFPGPLEAELGELSEPATQ